VSYVILKLILTFGVVIRNLMRRSSLTEAVGLEPTASLVELEPAFALTSIKVVTGL
jgi:hypothetical protein